MRDYLSAMEQALWDTNEHLGGDLLVTAVVRQGMAESHKAQKGKREKENG